MTAAPAGKERNCNQDRHHCLATGPNDSLDGKAAKLLDKTVHAAACFSLYQHSQTRQYCGAGAKVVASGVLGLDCACYLGELARASVAVLQVPVAEPSHPRGRSGRPRRVKI